MKSIAEIPLNNYADRRRFWEKMIKTIPPATLEEALMRVPAGKRNVITAHHLFNKPFSDICLEMNLSESAVRGYHQHGIFLLAKMLLPYL